MSDGSDIEMPTTLPKKLTKKIPKSPTDDVLKANEEPKKPSTKVMVHQALTDLKSRKGTSMYAIKKYIHDNFRVDVEKINYIIKKLIKAEVEAGTIVQTKGIGASGSFKLAVGKEKVQQKKAMVKKLVEKTKSGEEKSKKTKDAPAKPKTKSLEKKVKKKNGGSAKQAGGKIKTKEKGKGGDEKMKENNKEKSKSKAPKPKSAKAMQTPAKKRAALLKRKSIGSIIKPPKMRPKAKS